MKLISALTPLALVVVVAGLATKGSHARSAVGFSPATGPTLQYFALPVTAAIATPLQGGGPPPVPDLPKSTQYPGSGQTKCSAYAVSNGSVCSSASSSRKCSSGDWGVTQCSAISNAGGGSSTCSTTQAGHKCSTGGDFGPTNGVGETCSAVQNSGSEGGSLSCSVTNSTGGSSESSCSSSDSNGEAMCSAIGGSSGTANCSVVAAGGGACSSTAEGESSGTCSSTGGGFCSVDSSAPAGSSCTTNLGSGSSGGGSCSIQDSGQGSTCSVQGGGGPDSNGNCVKS